MKKLVFVLVSIFISVSAFAQEQLPYQNPRLSAQERAADLCSRLTLEEKAKLMLNSSPAIERLGIPAFEWWSECLHGVARNGYATMFPSCIGMAASFNDELLYDIYSAASDEGRAKYTANRKAGKTSRYMGISYWTPNINIFRDPRWGRGQETYGEDPYQNGRMGSIVVKGLQGTVLNANSKTVKPQNRTTAQPTTNREQSSLLGLPRCEGGRRSQPSSYGTLCDDIVPEKMQTVDLKKYYNSNIDDIFKNRYLSPRSPYTTLQIPVQGIGEWCHPQLMADINDSGFRNCLKGNTFNSSINIPFKSAKKGYNIIYTSLFDNYPDSVSVPLKGKASHAYLLMAGSTNHMQCHIANGKVIVTYADSTTTSLTLENPYNWCPIEQDYYVDGMAFSTIEPRPYRVLLKDCSVSRNFGKDLGITEVYGRELPSGAAEILDMKLNPEKELQCITILTLSNEVVIGLAGITLQKE